MPVSIGPITINGGHLVDFNTSTGVQLSTAHVEGTTPSVAWFSGTYPETGVTFNGPGHQRRVIGELKQPDDHDARPNAGGVESRLKIPAPSDLFSHRRQGADDACERESDDEIRGNLRVRRPSACAGIPVGESSVHRDGVRGAVDHERYGEGHEDDLCACDSPAPERHPRHEPRTL